eukprot:3940631-Rhodomonas_salina.2
MGFVLPDWAKWGVLSESEVALSYLVLCMRYVTSYSDIYQTDIDMFEGLCCYQGGADRGREQEQQVACPLSSYALAMRCPVLTWAFSIICLA